MPYTFISSNPIAFADFSYRSPANFSNNAPLYQQSPLNIPATPEINNNNRLQMDGIQFIPSRLSSGEFALALVMPKSGANGNENDIVGEASQTLCTGKGIDSHVRANSCHSTPDHWKPYYLTESMPLGHTIEFGIHERVFKSAFSNVTQAAANEKYLVKTSPLSPASPVSSVDESTSVDTSSTQRTPLKLNLTAFSTPSNDGTVSSIPTSADASVASTRTLQQSHVTSTTEQQATQKLRPIPLEVHLKDDILNTITMEYQKGNDDKKPLQQAYQHSDNDDTSTVTVTSSASSNENPNLDSGHTQPLQLKHRNAEPINYSIDSDKSNNINDEQSESCNSDMWRPW